MIFESREEAGKLLADKLERYKNKKVVVLALPKGGVPVGAEIAKHLNAPLDVLTVRKIGSPENPEFAIGAVASGGMWFLDKLTIKKLGISQEELDRLSKVKVTEMIKKDAKYHRNKKPINLEGKIVILVDDGVATGATMIAAIRAAEREGPKKIILAIPVCPEDAARDLTSLVSGFECLEIDKKFESVGAYYKKFDDVSDEEVAKLLV